jgi:hypothetical protein
MKLRLLVGLPWDNAVSLSTQTAHHKNRLQKFLQASELSPGFERTAADISPASFSELLPDHRLSAKHQ